MNHFPILIFLLLSIFVSIQTAPASDYIGYKEGYLNDFESQKVYSDEGTVYCDREYMYSSESAFVLTSFHFFCEEDSNVGMQIGLYDEKTGLIHFLFDFEKLNQSRSDVHNVIEVVDSPVFFAARNYFWCELSPDDSQGLFGSKVSRNARVKSYQQSLPSSIMTIDSDWYSDYTIPTWSWFDVQKADECPGFGTNDENEVYVCSGNGYCKSSKTCICNTEFDYEFDCSVTKCDGIFSNESNVCSGNGDCIGLNVCECSLAYIGDTCSEILTCSGKTIYDSDICSGHGSCEDIDSCLCEDGYVGDECEEKIECYGIGWDDEKVCNGKGDCKNKDDCSCNDGYTGDECNTFTCNGISADDESVCNYHGSCEDVDKCECDSYYYGDYCSYTNIESESNSNSSSSFLTALAFVVVWIVICCVGFCCTCVFIVAVVLCASAESIRNSMSGNGSTGNNNSGNNRNRPNLENNKQEIMTQNQEIDSTPDVIINNVQTIETNNIESHFNTTEEKFVIDDGVDTIQPIFEPPVYEPPVFQGNDQPFAYE